MRRLIPEISLLAVALTCGGAHAQFGGMGGAGGLQGPKIPAAIRKVFGEHKAFSARAEIEVPNPQSGGKITVPGKIASQGDQTRFELNLVEMKGADIPPDGMEQLQAMGMAEMLVITRQDKKANFIIYPKLKACVEMPLQGDELLQDESKLTAETTDLGSETVDGHPCTKAKVVVTDERGKQHEFTAWSATDLKKFPIRIQANSGNAVITTSFKDVKLEKPDTKLFEVDPTFTKYKDFMTMMQDVMSKRFGAGGGMPTPPAPR